MLGLFRDADMLSVLEGEITIDGPDPCNNAATNAVNRRAFELTNSQIFGIIQRSFTVENGGYNDSQGMDPSNGIALYNYLVTNAENTADNKIHVSIAEFYSCKQTNQETPRQYLTQLMIKAQSLRAANHNISVDSFNTTVVKGLLINEITRNQLLLHLTTNPGVTQQAFQHVMESVVKMESLPSNGKRKNPSGNQDHPPSKSSENKKSNSSFLCFNCGDPDHNSRQCPEPYNDEQWQINCPYYDSLPSQQSDNTQAGRGARNSGRGRGNSRGGRGKGSGGRGSGSGKGRTYTADEMKAFANAFHSKATEPPQSAPPSSSTNVDTFFNSHVAAVTSADDAADKFLNDFFTPENTNCMAPNQKIKPPMNDPNHIIWMFDTACGSHLTNRTDAYDKQPSQPSHSMMTATGDVMPVSSQGISSCGFPDVKLALNSKFSLFSKPQMVRDNWNLKYDQVKDTFTVTNPHTHPPKEYVFSEYEGYHFYTHPRKIDPIMIPSALTVGAAAPPLHARTKAVYEFLLWHQRFNHINYGRLKQLISTDLITGFKHNISLVVPELLPKCKVCMLWKMHRTSLPSPQGPPRPPRPGMLISADAKIFKVNMHGKVNTVYTLVDHHSSFSWSYWLHHPNPEADAFLNKAFKPFYDNVCIPKNWLHFTFHPDSATNFTSKAMKDYCLHNGIILDPSPKYTSHQNGLAEVVHHKIALAAITSLHTAKLHNAMFPFAWMHAEQVRNAIPMAPHEKSSAFLMDGSTVSGNFSHTFGCCAYIYNDHHRKATLECPAREARFLGYAPNGHRTQVFALDVKNNVISPFPTANIVFNEKNTEAQGHDLDVNQQLELLETIDEASQSSIQQDKFPEGTKIQMSTDVPLRLDASTLKPPAMAIAAATPVEESTLVAKNTHHTDGVDNVRHPPPLFSSLQYCLHHTIYNVVAAYLHVPVEPLH